LKDQSPPLLLFINFPALILSSGFILEATLKIDVSGSNPDPFVIEKACPRLLVKVYIISIRGLDSEVITLGIELEPEILLRDSSE
jgi:hypothetical protein